MKVDWKSYVVAARKTAIYPDGDSGKIYIRLGLLGEIGEVANKYKKIIRRDYTEAEIARSLIKELGDVCWYLAMISFEYPFLRADDSVEFLIDNRHPVPKTPLEVVDNLFEVSTELYRYLYLASKLDETISSSSVNSSIRANHTLTIGLLAEFCFLLGVELQDVMNDNIIKLCSRAKRGTLQGTGDER